MEEDLKQLLLKDLLARLPYGVKVLISELRNDVATLIGIDDTCFIVKYDKSTIYCPFNIDIKPYYRPLSSMTEEECMELSKIRPFDDDVDAWKYVKTPVPLKIANIKHFDFFHSHHLDWRGLIEKGLALVAHEGMYK